MVSRLRLSRRATSPHTVWSGACCGQVVGWLIRSIIMSQLVRAEQKHEVSVAHTVWSGACCGRVENMQQKREVSVAPHCVAGRMLRAGGGAMHRRDEARQGKTVKARASGVKQQAAPVT